jgi:glycosyltransferase involved in cell wall biosynthesis
MVCQPTRGKTLKIVQLLESSATGTLSMVCMIANRLALEGHEVHVIYSIRNDTPANLRMLFHRDVVLRHIQMKNARVLSAVAELRKALKTIQPDVVHLHSSFGGFLGRIAALFSFHETAFFYSPHCISFMRRDVSTLKRVAFAGLEWIACVRKCLYIACSQSERAAIRTYLRRPVVVIENAVASVPVAGIDNATGDAMAQGCIVTVGGIRAQKNPRLFAEIARRSKDLGVRFLWIGDGDAVLKDELRAAGVEVSGWLGRTEVMSCLQRASLYLSTASWEGMPVSVIEAMLLGLPAVVSACAGNVDVVRHLDTGAIFGTAEEAVELIARLAGDAVLREDMAVRARAEAESRFCEDRFFNELIPFYVAGLEGRTRRNSPTRFRAWLDSALAVTYPTIWRRK